MTQGLSVSWNSHLSAFIRETSCIRRQLSQVPTTGQHAGNKKTAVCFLLNGPCKSQSFPQCSSFFTEVVADYKEPVFSRQQGICTEVTTVVRASLRAAQDEASKRGDMKTLSGWGASEFTFHRCWERRVSFL